jgi:amino acid transporter
LEPKGSTTRLLKPLSLIAIIFFSVSGGPYGLEPLLQFAGKNGALVLLMIVPILWDIPTVLTVLELNSMMPQNGGYYLWVNRALGLKWAFFEGWWTWLYSFTDLAIYPVLFVTYLSYFFPALIAYKLPICLLIIWGCSGLNILGIVSIRDISIILGTIVIIPFFLLFGTAFCNSTFHLSLPTMSLKGIGFTPFGMALYTIMWNISGWDNTTTYAGEVDKPLKSYFISMAIAFVLIIIMYLLTTSVAIGSEMDPATLSTNGYPSLGTKMSIPWLAALLSLGGMASAIGIFCSMILSISRIPKVMADDKLLPSKFNTLHKRFKTPYISIIVCAILVSLMIAWSFTDLLIIDIILYGAGLCLEFISLIVLRIKEPNTQRPFKIPLKLIPLCIIISLPMVVYFIALFAVFKQSGSVSNSVIFAIAALLSAPVAWIVIEHTLHPDKS